MKQLKKALSVFLQLVLILSAFSVLPVSAARLDESVQDSTAMGKDIQWIVDEAQLRDFALLGTAQNDIYFWGITRLPPTTNH